MEIAISKNPLVKLSHYQNQCPGLSIIPPYKIHLTNTLTSSLNNIYNPTFMMPPCDPFKMVYTVNARTACAYKCQNKPCMHVLILKKNPATNINIELRLWWITCSRKSWKIYYFLKSVPWNSEYNDFRKVYALNFLNLFIYFWGVEIKYHQNYPPSCFNLKLQPTVSCRFGQHLRFKSRKKRSSF